MLEAEPDVRGKRHQPLVMAQNAVSATTEIKQGAGRTVRGGTYVTAPAGRVSRRAPWRNDDCKEA